MVDIPVAFLCPDQARISEMLHSKKLPNYNEFHIETLMATVSMWKQMAIQIPVFNLR